MDPPVQIDVFEEEQPVLGRQSSQMDLADAVLWTGKNEPKPLVEKGSFHDRFAAVRLTILRDEDFEHWFDAEMGRRSIPPSVVAGAFLLALREGCSDREAEQRMRYDLRWKWAGRRCWRKHRWPTTASTTAGPG